MARTINQAIVKLGLLTCWSFSAAGHRLPIAKHLAQNSSYFPFHSQEFVVIPVIEMLLDLFF